MDGSDGRIQYADLRQRTIEAADVRALHSVTYFSLTVVTFLSAVPTRQVPWSLPVAIVVDGFVMVDNLRKKGTPRHDVDDESLWLTWTSRSNVPCPA